MTGECESLAAHTLASSPSSIASKARLSLLVDRLGHVGADERRSEVERNEGRSLRYSSSSSGMDGRKAHGSQ